MNGRRRRYCSTVCLLAICLFLSGCQISLFGLGQTLDQAVKSLSAALGIELKMVKVPEQVHKFDRWVSQGGPPTLEALGPAKGPAAYTLTVALGPNAPSRLVTLLDVIVPEWNDRKAWLETALRQLQSAPKPKGRIRMKPSGNRVVVLMVDKQSNRASLSIMTLVWSDYAQHNACAPIVGPCETNRRRLVHRPAAPKSYWVARLEDCLQSGGSSNRRHCEEHLSKRCDAGGKLPLPYRS